MVMMKEALDTIIALENAYSNKDLDKVLSLKDFKTEAILTLEKAGHELSPDLIIEVAEMLKLSLIQHLQENGYPDFSDAIREFSNLEQIRENLYFLTEEIIHTDGETYKNRVTLSKYGDDWKVVDVDDA